MEWLTDPASLQGVAMRTDWYVFLAAGIAVGIFVYVCIGWCLIAYRERSGRVAEQFENNKPLEILYVVVPLLMVFALFGVTYAIEMPIDRAGDPPNRICGDRVSLVVAIRVPQRNVHGRHAGQAADALSSRRTARPRSSCVPTT